MAAARKHDDPKGENLPKGAKTVTVACKYPPGLILRVFKFTDQQVPAPGGMRVEQVAMQYGDSVNINGPAAPVRQQSPHETAGGFALTHNVDADFMAEWFKQNADSHLVKNGLIFVAGNRADARDRAEDHREVRTGVEPLDMSVTMKNGVEVVADKRVGRGSKGRSEIIPADVRPSA